MADNLRGTEGFDEEQWREDRLAEWDSASSNLGSAKFLEWMEKDGAKIEDYWHAKACIYHRETVPRLVNELARILTELSRHGDFA